MSEINKYNTNSDYSYLFSNNISNLNNTSINGGIDLADYASIKNGSYGKLLKSYYSQQETEGVSGSKEETQNLTKIKSNADALKKSADVLNNASLWDKKKITKKDETTGEEIEIEEYDWDGIIKAVDSFISNYNSMVEEAGNTDTKSVLRNAVWMTSMTSKTGNLLGQVGIKIGEGNRLEADKDALKKADISTLRTLFVGHNSYASRVSQKASSIGNATSRISGSYTNSGSYSSSLSELVSGTMDKEI